MKSTIVYIAIILGLFVACKAQKIEQSTMCGTFYKLDKNKLPIISYTLELKPDSTFKVSVHTPAGNPRCTGKWKVVDNTFVQLNCSEEDDPYPWMSTGYMGLREHKLEIISKDKIKYMEGVVLKRKQTKP